MIHICTGYSILGYLGRGIFYLLPFDCIWIPLSPWQGARPSDLSAPWGREREKPPPTVFLLMASFTSPFAAQSPCYDGSCLQFTKLSAFRRQITLKPPIHQRSCTGQLLGTLPTLRANFFSTTVTDDHSSTWTAMNEEGDDACGFRPGDREASL